MTTIQAPTLPGPAIPNSATTSQLGGQTLGKQDFLRLLITQLQHQDPLNPMDQNQFLSQTAQFSSLEQLQNINQALSDLAVATSSTGVAQAATLLGKTAKVAGRDFSLGTTGAAALPFKIEGSPAPVRVSIYDTQGNLVRTVNANPGAAGSFTAAWDGLDGDGHRMAAGQYYYRVAPVGGDASTVVSAAQGVLSGFQITGGSLRYRLGTALIRSEDVIDVQQ
jgi:flagellar basal-body rod modification protein FlgD